MIGKFYAIKKGKLSKYIQGLIDESKFGSVVMLPDSYEWECVIEVEELNSINAVELTVEQAKEMTHNDSD